jgi:hypothetical protein
VVGSVVDDPASAAHLSDGTPRSRRFDTSPLAKSLHTTAASLHGQLQRSAERVRS